MLILARKANERILITTPAGERILLTVSRIDDGRVRLGFDAPDNVEIMREELLPPHRQAELARHK